MRHRLPYADLTHLSDEERAAAFGPDGAVEFGHSLVEQVGGQAAAGFAIVGFDEAPHDRAPLAAFMPGYFATRALKRG